MRKKSKAQPKKAKSRSVANKPLSKKVLGQLAALKANLMISSVGVHQAIDALNSSLEELESALDYRKFEEASLVGYQSLATNFIFLQRALGGLQHYLHEKDSIIQEQAFKRRCAYEDVAPLVEKELSTRSKQ